MAFLPEEFSSADERSRMFELPSNDISPLVKEHRQVSMRVNPLSVGRVHDSLRSRSDGNRLSHFTLSTFGYPGNFRRESLNMLLFLVQGSLSYKHREVSVLHSKTLKSFVHKVLDLFPDVERSRSKDIATRNFIIFNQVRLSNNLSVPFREVLLFFVLNSIFVSISNLLGFLDGGLRLLGFLFGGFLTSSGSSSSTTSHRSKI